ncbi:LIC_20245 family lipoprotein [Leptospira wolffii]|uniref:LIC_20245 family lipoprotein n=1 Tax=Leptospira wolffii TaxID=409998 RepID=UPI0010824E10|nr:hypothetical protein EHQ61_15115 [Leptospira wolffii]
MNRKRLTLLLVFVFLCAFALYLLFESSEDKESSKFQGGLSQETLLRKENSVFEGGTGFLDFSASAEEESANSSQTPESSSSSKPKSYWESLSEEDKAKLYEKMYEKYKPLLDKFPNNSLIPKKLSEEEQAKKKEAEDRYYRIQRDILERKDVPKEEMGFYLDTKLKRSDDMTEILKYGLETYKKASESQALNPEFERLIRERLESIEKSREEVLTARKALNP